MTTPEIWRTVMGSPEVKMTSRESVWNMVATLSGSASTAYDVWKAFDGSLSRGAVSGHLSTLESCGMLKSTIGPNTDPDTCNHVRTVKHYIPWISPAAMKEIAAQDHAESKRLSEVIEERDQLIDQQSAEIRKLRQTGPDAQLESLKRSLDALCDVCGMPRFPEVRDRVAMLGLKYQELMLEKKLSSNAEYPMNGSAVEHRVS
jgi:hypothetical protein